MNAFTAWASVTIALLFLIALAIYISQSLVPLWLAILPFLANVSSGGKEERP